MMVVSDQVHSWENSNVLHVDVNMLSKEQIKTKLFGTSGPMRLFYWMQFDNDNSQHILPPILHKKEG